MKPAHVQEALADRTLWSPLVPGGTNFTRRRLADTGEARLEYRALPGSLAFGGLFLSIGILALAGAAAWATLVDWAVVLPMGIPVFVGLVFVGIGAAHLAQDVAPVRFDKRNGRFRRGRARCSLTDIRAIQLLAERGTVAGRYTAASFLSYEINLVLADGSRTNVVDHGDDPATVHRDASRIAEFLSVPVWDATADPA